MRIRFVKDPTGKYNLCYEIGEEINLPDSQAMDMIEDGYAIPVLTKPQNAKDKLIAVESR
jgi:hypothetical protein